MTLYLPGSFLVPGTNEVLVMELEGRLPMPQSAPVATGTTAKLEGDGSGGKEGREVEGGFLPTIVTVDQPDFGGPPGGVEPL
jgi:hypothetical protein